MLLSTTRIAQPNMTRLAFLNTLLLANTIASCLCHSTLFILVTAMSPSPSIPAAAAAASRTIARVVAPTITNPAITRLIGTVDIDGAGTQHALPEVDPFILLDCGTVTQHNKPPFGPHPHRGHSVVTILLGGKVQSWDSFHGERKHVLSAPASYWVDAGSGVFHDEKSVIDNEEDPSQHMRLFQLWIGVSEADRLKPPRIQYSEKLPTLDCTDPSSGKVVGQAIYHVGEGTGIETPHPISVAHITQLAGTTYHVPIVPTHGGFVIHMNGKATYGGDDSTSCVENVNTVLVLDNTDDDETKGGASYLQVTADAESSGGVEYLVCSGERIQEPWVKKLVANGAIITQTAEEARALAPKVEAMSKAGKAEGGSFAPFGS